MIMNLSLYKTKLFVYQAQNSERAKCTQACEIIDYCRNNENNNLKRCLD